MRPAVLPPGLPDPTKIAPEVKETRMPDATAPVIDLDRPYLGWFDHYAAGWQAVIVRQRDGRTTAYRLGDELSYERATEMCQVLSEVTGVPVAGELSKRDGFRPISRIEETPDHG